MIKKVLLWLLSSFLLLSAIVYFPQPVSFLLLLLTCFSLPIPTIQSFIKKFLSTKVRTIVIIFLSIATLFLIPSNDTEANAPSNDETSGSSLSNTASSPTDNISTTGSTSTQPTTNHPTSPSVTEPPITEPPVTEPPVTEPPVTEPPVTEPPVTEPPVSEPNEGIIFVDWPTTIGRNETATVTIKGKPNTTYHIYVYYKSGPSTADGLESKASDSNGYVSWSWKIGGRTSPGTFEITVSGGGERATVKYTIVE